MTRLATAGTSSCATISIAHFKGDNMDLNEAYKADKNSFSGLADEDKTVKNFYDDVLYPISQPLGHTGEYPFERLMEEIDDSEMSTKFILATLNSWQFNKNDKYWPKELERHGFKLVDVTDNTIGERCYIFVRNNNRPNNVEEIISKHNGD